MDFKSYLWSIQKKKWLPGPDVGDFSYDNACGVSLNTTSVLIIGAAKGPYILINDHVETLIYNFELKTLSYQHSLPREFKGSSYEWYWSAKTSNSTDNSSFSMRSNDKIFLNASMVLGFVFFISVQPFLYSGKPGFISILSKTGLILQRIDLSKPNFFP